MTTPARRTEIRNAFAAAITGLPTAGGRVFVSRMRPLDSADLPAVLVFSGEDSPEAVLTSGKVLLRSYQLRADILVKERDGAEDTADAVLQEMVAALCASPAAMTLGGKVTSLRYIGAGAAEMDITADKPAVRIPVLFEVKYA